MSSKTFITGGAGFIGSHVVDECLSRGHTVCVYDNFAVGRREHLPEENEKLQIIEGDILDKEVLNKALKDFAPTHVIHLAALHYIPYCNGHPLETIDVNVKGTEQVLSVVQEVCTEGLQRVVFASSAAVYAPSEELHREEEEAHPMDIYGVTKYTNESQGYLFNKRTGVDTVAARIFNAYGNRETNPHLIPEIIQQIQKGNDVIELGNVTTKRSYIFVKDLARGLVDMVEDVSFAGFTTCNIGSHKEYNAVEILQMLSDIVGREITHASVASRQRKSDRPRLQPRLDRVETLSWKEDYDMIKGLQEIVSQEL